MSNTTKQISDKAILMMGNEAIARGAIEAGVGVAAAYPGTPSSEIIDTLSKSAKEHNIYVEWSVNEKVALEVAAGASVGGIRAITALKQLGMNVALDFLANINLTGIKSGLVVVACDDPGALSSTNEQDSRNFAKMLDLPLLEPSSPQEAKEITRWAFELSEQIANVCIVRSVTRISHSRGNISSGKIPERKYDAVFDTKRRPYTTIMEGAPSYHRQLHENMASIAALYETSPFNWYTGPEDPRLLVITCGSGWLYSQEAVELLKLEDSVGILKLGTTWPLPAKLVKKHMMTSDKILVVEEVDAFLESNLKELACDMGQGRNWTFYGKSSGHMNPYGENNPDIVVKALAKIMDSTYVSNTANYSNKAEAALKQHALPRETQFCAGCPHRGLFWAVKDALKKDGRNGFVTGDIGCYGSGAGSTGFEQLKTMHSMGSGIGMASGLGKLGQFGFDQPVMTVCGDSTFFHAAIPALVNGIHHKSNFIFLILDNSGTAMTGFQPHPGSSTNAMGETAPAVDIGSICRVLGVPVEIVDPYDTIGTTEKLLDVLRAGDGPRVVIAQRECALMRARKKKALYKMRIDADLCKGCKICTRSFKCPGLMWNNKTEKAEIDTAICDGCGVCVNICPADAILREENE